MTYAFHREAILYKMKERLGRRFLVGCQFVRVPVQELP